MELAIRNKWISLRGSSIVKDVNENDVLKVRGKFFTVTSKKFVTTLDDEVKYIVRNKFWRIFHRKAYIYNSNKEIVARIKRKIFSVHDRYFIETSLGNIELMGNIFQFNYSIKLNGEEIGHVARKISLRDSFVLTINDDQDYMFFVALVIALDNMTDKRDADHSN